MLTLILFALGLLPADDVLRDRVDVLEQNHFFNEHGCLIFDQLIGWQQYADAEHVVFWRLAKGDSLIPQRDWQYGGYYVHFLDGDGSWRYIRATAQRETWTQQGLGGDPELIDRESWPKERRRELRVR